LPVLGCNPPELVDFNHKQYSTGEALLESLESSENQTGEDATAEQKGYMATARNGVRK